MTPEYGRLQGYEHAFAPVYAWRNVASSENRMVTSPALAA